jgi:glycosyltransferase involved in cell wall biosynthesis
VTDGETGLLFPVGDVAQMAAGAVSLLTDPARHALFKARARNRAEASFNADDIIPRYEAFYEELLGQ